MFHKPLEFLFGAFDDDVATFDDVYVILGENGIAIIVKKLVNRDE